MRPLSVHSVSRQGSLSLHSVSRQGPLFLHSVKSADEAPSPSTQSADKAPSSSTQSTDEAPSPSTQSADKAPSSSTQSADKASSPSTQLAEKSISLSTQSAENQLSLATLSAELAEPSFTEEEKQRFQIWYEKGFDVVGDKQYACSVQLYHPDALQVMDNEGVETTGHLYWAPVEGTIVDVQDIVTPMMHYDVMLHLVFFIYWTQLCIIVSCPGVRSRAILFWSRD